MDVASQLNAALAGRYAIALFERVGLPRRVRICNGILDDAMTLTDDVH